MFKDDLLKNKRILVTGGGTGLGKEMASHYAQHGADLYICGRRENVLKETATEIEDKYNVNVKYETLDIRASNDVEDYIDRIFQALEVLSSQKRDQNRSLKLVEDYNVDNVSEKIIRIIISYTDFIKKNIWKQ